MNDYKKQSTFEETLLNFFLSVLLLLGICPVQMYGQSFSYLGIEQGLSNSTVTTIYKDRHGLMWFGTFDGLNRFDGYNFTRFRNHQGDTTSVPDNYITALEEDAAGRLWVGTTKGIGVFNDRLLNLSAIHFKNPDSNEQRAPVLRDWINGLKCDTKGNMFITSKDLGLLCVKGGTRTAFKIPLPGRDHLKLNNHGEVLCLAIDFEDNVWFVVDEQGLYCRDAKSGKVKLMNTSVKNGNCIRQAADGEFWIGTNNGLYSYNPKSKEMRAFKVPGTDLASNRILSLCFEKNGNLWMSTDGNGLIVLDVRKEKVVQVFKAQANKSLTSNALYDVLIDEASRKWIGTMRGGINVLDPKKNRFQTISNEPYNNNSLIHNTVLSFCEDGDEIWVGTDGGGISIWNPKLNTFKHQVFNTTDRSQAGTNQIPSMIRDQQNNIWIATYGSGVKRYNRKNGVFEDIPFVQRAKGSKYVWRLYLDADQNLWAACVKGKWAGNLTKGLYKYDRKQNSFVETSWPIHKEIISIVDDNLGNLWLGTLSSLLRVNKKTGKIKQFNLDSYVRALYVSKSGKICIGTSGRGFWLYDPDKDQFKNFTEEHGLPNNIVVTIEEDQSGYLWLGTSGGLSRFNPKIGKFENFYAADGLQSNQFYYNASIQLKNGKVLFGGIKGFNSFNPDSIAIHQGFPQITLSSLRIMNNPVNAESEFVKKANSAYDIQEIKLPYDKSMFSLDFVALEYSLPDKIQYAYLLSGWDKAWNFIKAAHVVSYSRLNPGSYTLKIRSTNASGAWNPKFKEIKITVLPPWYLSWWAYVCYLILAGSAVYAYVYYQKEQTRLLYEVKLAKQDTLKEAELNEKKISFFTNIAHEFRAPLTLIVNPIKDLLTNDGKNINIIDISSVYRNTRRLLSLVDQLLLFRNVEQEVSDLKPEVLDLVEVCHEVFLCFNNQVKQRQLDYQFLCDSQNIGVFADREKIEIVLFNLLSNAIKYTPEKGNVVLELKEIGSDAEIRVRDSGPGIPIAVGSKLFEKFQRLDQGRTASKKTGFGIGLFVSKKITEQQGAQLTYTSAIDEGTTFIYLLPRETALLEQNKAVINISSGTPLLTELIVDQEEVESTSAHTISDALNKVYGEVVENKPNVLLIDDDDELRNYIKQFLKESYTIYEANSAEQGFELLKQSEPDVIVCDVVMPGMSGVAFCSKIKSSSEFAYIPLILLTGTSSPEVKLKGIECGADDYITKPFEKEILIARIRAILKARASLKKYFFNEVTLQNNNEKVSEEYSQFLKQCMEIIERHLQDEDFNVKAFVKEMAMSHSNVFRKVKSVSGVSISEFIRYIRLKKAAELMIESDVQIKEVAFRVGMQDLRYFREQFSKLFGLNPSNYIKKYRRKFLGASGNN